MRPLWDFLIHRFTQLMEVGQWMLRGHQLGPPATILGGGLPPEPGIWESRWILEIGNLHVDPSWSVAVLGQEVDIYHHGDHTRLLMSSGKKGLLPHYDDETKACRVAPARAQDVPCPWVGTTSSWGHRCL